MYRVKYIGKIVENLLKSGELSEFQQEEIFAIISHWVQTSDDTLPYLTKDLLNRFLQIEQKYFYNIAIDEVDKGVSDSGPRNRLFDFMLKNISYPPPTEWDFTFIDLFAGIGGFRLAFQEAGGKCVFSSEWDKYACQTYEANFGEYPYGDICRIDKNDIPNHDVLCAGFPCQPFSLAGVSKKNSMGRKHGFEDETQGTLFFDIKEILRLKRPKAFMLENVKNLLSHDNGRTFEVIRHSLEDQLGYVVNWKIVDGANWVPQHRERIFIVGYDPKQINIEKDNIIIPSMPENGYTYTELRKIIQRHVDGYTIGPGTWDTLVRHKKNHAEKGNGFGYSLHCFPIKLKTVTRTISARYHKDGAEILIDQMNERPRKLTIDEAMQLQGYDPALYRFPVSKTQAYKQIGNSVVVPAVKECAFKIKKILEEMR